MPLRVPRITATIQREWLAQIIDETKKIEYFDINPYRTNRLEQITYPFELRLINGMTPPVPEVIVLIGRARTNKRSGCYELHNKKILDFSIGTNGGGCRGGRSKRITAERTSEK